MFLCTGNACRSQMAEGWARHLHGDRIDVCSAGINPHGLNPTAVRAMSEAGVDISAHTSKTVESCSPETLDLVVTVCGHAHENCPVFVSQNPRTRVIHHGFDDPPVLAADALNEDDAMRHYRRVRDEIRLFIETLPALLEQPAASIEGVNR
ncbi:arsenate reductase ArsC [Mucisphaera sp.]|uniref:arsenate reductase ArsC n=1 Tax=Mucisphaera sp. TaxID=2913024 RepID=UPI003D0F1D2A